MKVFIEQTTQKNKKNVFNKETKRLLKTTDFHLTYPYPYGYIQNTLAEDGDELDCYILTDQILRAEQVIECNPIGMVEFFEDGESDHKIFMVPTNEIQEITEEIKKNLKYFNDHFFDNKPDQESGVIGRYLGKKEAELEIQKTLI